MNKKKEKVDKYLKWAIFFVSTCDQSDETIDHLLVSCVFSQQVWFTILQGFGSQDLTPQKVEPSFEEWWDNINKRVSGQGKKGLNSIIILGA